jgi:hypothetical protein
MPCNFVLAASLVWCARDCLGAAGVIVVQGWRVAERAAGAVPHAASSIFIPVLTISTLTGATVCGAAPHLIGIGSRAAALLASAVGSVLAATVAISALAFPTGVSTLSEVRCIHSARRTLLRQQKVGAADDVICVQDAKQEPKI